MSADQTCNKFCPTGDRGECPGGMECFANTDCDGRDTPPPTESPAPTITSPPVDSFSVSVGGSDGGSVSSGGGTSTSGNNGNAGQKHETCTLCPNNELYASGTITINGKQVTCRGVQNMFYYENVQLGSDNCVSVQKMYEKTCCYNRCNLCEASNGEILDLLDLLIHQGGYSASCQEVNNILASTPKEVKMCSDAKEQLAGQCCYDQCALCDESAGEATSWYATVDYQGIQSTCLGLDFMLRSEQVGSSANRCSSIRSMYKSACCYVAPAEPCQLCEADGVVYEVNMAKSVSVTERASMTSCVWVNDNLAKLSSGDEKCEERKGAYFGQCCELSSVLSYSEGGQAGSSTSSTGGGEDDGGAVSGARPNGEAGATDTSLAGGEGGNETSPEQSYWGNTGVGEWNPSEWNPPSTGTSTGLARGVFLCFFGAYLYL